MKKNSKKHQVLTLSWKFASGYKSSISGFLFQYHSNNKQQNYAFLNLNEPFGYFQLLFQLFSIFFWSKVPIVAGPNPPMGCPNRFCVMSSARYTVNLDSKRETNRMLTKLYTFSKEKLLKPLPDIAELRLIFWVCFQKLGTHDFVDPLLKIGIGL